MKYLTDIFRRKCKNIKLRRIYYRLISRDFYTKERMLRFRMSRDDEFERCGLKETYRHLLRECRELGIVWQAFNAYLNKINQPLSHVNSYEDIFDIEPNKILSVNFPYSLSFSLKQFSSERVCVCVQVLNTFLFFLGIMGNFCFLTSSTLCDRELLSLFK